MIRIIADSTCDLSKELIEKYNIQILPLYLHMGEKEYRDGMDITPDEIYEWSDEYNVTPQTSAPSIEDAIAVFEPYKNSGDDVIAFAISGNISASAQVMRLAAENIEYDEHIFVIDSKNLSTGIGLLIIETAKMIEEGKNISGIVRHIEALKNYVRSSFVVDTLKYLHRGGRCSATSSLVGGVFKIKPKIVVEAGKMIAQKKYRGTLPKVIISYVKDMEGELKKAKKDRIFITHSGCDESIIEGVRNYIDSLNHFEEILITRAGSIISSHCGPGTLGVLFIADGTSYGPYDEQFDANDNGIMEEEEKIQEEAYIRHIVEEEKNKNNEEEEDDE